MFRLLRIPTSPYYAPYQLARHLMTSPHNIHVQKRTENGYQDINDDDWNSDETARLAARRACRALKLAEEEAVKENVTCSGDLEVGISAEVELGVYKIRINAKYWST